MEVNGRLLPCVQALGEVGRDDDHTGDLAGFVESESLLGITAGADEVRPVACRRFLFEDVRGQLCSAWALVLVDDCHVEWGHVSEGDPEDEQQGGWRNDATGQRSGVGAEETDEFAELDDEASHAMASSRWMRLA